jgi:hypothetical protein
MAANEMNGSQSRRIPSMADTSLRPAALDDK